MADIPTFPHCDQRVLHAPGECEFCDACPEWQALRKAWGIAFTGKIPAIFADRCGKMLPPDTNIVFKQSDICRLERDHEGRCSPEDPWERLPCPADMARPPGSPSDSQNWPGNRPEGYSGTGTVNVRIDGGEIFTRLREQIRRSRPREMGEGDE